MPNPPSSTAPWAVVWVVGGRTKVVWDFTIVDDKITHIAMLAAPETINDLDLTVSE